MRNSSQAARLPAWFAAALAVIAPTWLLANYLVSRGDETRVLNRLNRFWLGASVVLFLAILFWTGNRIALVQQPSGWPVSRFGQPLCLVFAYFLWSRCTHIGFVFLRDAYEQLGEAGAMSIPRSKNRIMLAFMSYLELIINFAMLYAVCPADSWQHSQDFYPTRLTDVLYFSATTITTSGNGAMIPKGGLLQLASTYEIFCGLTLLVVCFTIYTSAVKGTAGPTDVE